MHSDLNLKVSSDTGDVRCGPEAHRDRNQPVMGKVIFLRHSITSKLQRVETCGPITLPNPLLGLSGPPNTCCWWTVSTDVALRKGYRVQYG